MHPRRQPHHLHQLLHPRLLLIHDPLEIWFYICFVIGHLEDGRHDEGEGEDEEERHDETEQQRQVVAGEVIWEICICNLVF